MLKIRDYAVSVLASLSENKMKEFIKLFADEDTLTRIEIDLLANDPNAKTYSNFEEFIKDMENEENVQV